MSPDELHKAGIYWQNNNEPFALGWHLAVSLFLAHLDQLGTVDVRTQERLVQTMEEYWLTGVHKGKDIVNTVIENLYREGNV